MHQFDPVLSRFQEGATLSEADIERLSLITDDEIDTLFFVANRLRQKHFGNRVHLCSIINAKSGRCPENCAFCAQSVHHSTDAPVYPLASVERIVAEAGDAAARGARCYGIVTSGTRVSDREIDTICEAVRIIRERYDITPSCSLGILSQQQLLKLKEAGVGTYHHNLETSRSFFPRICTTHDYEEDVETIRAAKRVGLPVCSGGLFGMGEERRDRVELALLLRELGVDSIPLNFLNPVPGTPLAGLSAITPRECLVTIAIFRVITPRASISVCGGREYNLRDLQSWIFTAGANGMMIGNYLTTSGRNPEDDHRMLADLGLEPEGCHG
ncbi:MAG: biotin synthase BioB [Desulfuromonadia bacterium]